MAFTFDVSTIPATGAVIVYKLVTALLAQTWTKPRDSDGTTYSPSGVQVSSGNSGTNGLANTNAWFVVRDPNSTRSFCFQRGTTNTLWRVKYSKSAGFTGGSPAATQVPSATDEQVFYGGGTDASPTFQQVFGSGSDGTLRVNICAGDSTVGYSFYLDCFTSGLPSSTHNVICLDVLSSGSYPVSDTDPAVVYATPVNGSTNAFGSDLYQNVTSAHAYMGASWMGVHGIVGQDSSSATRCWPADVAGQGVGSNPVTGEDAGVPLPYGRSIGHTGPQGFKGFGSFLRYAGTFRACGDTISNTGVNSRDRIWVNGCLLPWDGSVPVL
jgi:hypothetical protein